MNEEAIEDFLLRLFGEGFTQGDITLENNDTYATVTSRDFDVLFDFIHLNGGESTILLHSVTSAKELIAITDGPDGLEPTFDLINGDKTVSVWLSEVPLKPESFPVESQIFPLPGVAGWSVAPRSGLGYTLEELTPVTQKLDLSAPVAISIASDHTSDSWKKLPMSRGDLIAELLTHSEGKKEGTCLLQGWMFEAPKTTRKAAMMMENYIICLDLDNGTSFKEIDEKMAKSGYAYVRYTTHSHNSMSTDVSKKQYARFFGDDAEVTLQGLKQWLHDEKGYLKEVCATATEFKFVQKPDGDFYSVSHGPVAKNRIIVFLKEPFQLRGEKAVASATERWKERYLGLAESIGLSYDRACTDAARLFYFPRHPKGRTDFEAKFFDGEAVDILSIQPVKPSQLRAKNKNRKASSGKVDTSSPLAIATSFLGDGTPSETVGLYQWSKTHSFEIVDAIKDHSPDMILDMKAKGGKGAHIICPNEDMHSKAGGSGTYAVNASASENGEFELFCTHSHCIDLGKIGLLQLMIERGDFFSEEVLTDENYAPSLLIEEEPKKETSKPEVSKESTPKDQEQSEEPKDKKKKKDKKEVEPSKLIETLENINALYSSVKMEGGETKFIKFVPHGINEKGYEWMNKDSINMEINKDFKIKNIDKPIFNIWLEWEGRVHYDAIRFDPKNVDNSRIFNTFKGFNAIKAKKGDWGLFRNHLMYAVCKGNEFHYNVMMTWFAHMVQRPWEKPGFALVISGGKGAGKTAIAKFFSKILMPYAKSLVKAEQISGKFNAHFDNNIFTLIDEAFFAGDTQSDSAIKSIITEVDMEIEAKGQDAVSKKNYTRLMFTSNEDWVVKASADFERRYFCFHLPHVTDAIAHAKKFEEIFNQMEKEGGLEALLYDLENWVPPFAQGWDILRNAPSTVALADQQRASLSMLEQFYVDFLTYGYTCEDTNYEPIELSEENKNRFNYFTFKAHYTKSIFRAKSGRFKSIKDFHDSLTKYLSATFEADNTSKYILTPSLKELRDKFNKESQFKINRENFPRVDNSLKLVKSQ